jgi:hypothetical protein
MTARILLVPAALALAGAWTGASADPLDAALDTYQKKVHKALEAEVAKFEKLQNGSPRAVVRWKGSTHQFPPIPDLEPSLEELKGTYALAALPGSWVLSFNEIGGKLFLDGLRDGKTGVPAEGWKSLQDDLGDREIPRADIPEVGDILPGYSPKVDYASRKVPYQELALVQAEVRKTLANIPGASRRTVYEVPDDQAVGGVLISTFERHHKTAKKIGEALREKVAGVAMKHLLDLQAEVHGALRTKLGRDPLPDDIAKFGKLMSKEWRKLARFKHARDYFAGFRAMQSSNGGTGSGTASDLLPVGGTGGGTSGGTMEGTGTGTGTTGEDAPIGQVPGGGTGDGAAEAKDEGSPGTGQG